MSIKDFYFTLNTGARIPLLGLGTDGINGPDITLRILNDALQMGYRLFDTDAIYENEKDIGYALERLLPKFGLKRSDIFITTKLDPKFYGTYTSSAIKKSLKNLNCGYIDLYILKCPEDVNKFNLINLSWKKMIYAVQKKMIKQIGVSNYKIPHLENMLARKYNIRPSVNQVEFHPFCRDRKLLDLCKQSGIFVQAYKTLGGRRWSDFKRQESIMKCADSLGKTPAQILLRWAIQQKVGVNLKPQNNGHLFSNMQLDFTIPDEHMLNLSTLQSLCYEKKINFTCKSK